MIQLIFMVVGVVYLFKLIALNGKTGSNLGLDAETLAKWQGHRRKQYIWMIAAGWGSFVMMLVAGVVVGAMMAAGGNVTEGGAFGAQIGVTVVGLIVMGSCYSVSSGAAKKAKELEAGKARPVSNS